jgi:hypothetical protein
MKTRIFGDDRISVLCSIVTYLGIARRLHAQIEEVRTVWVHTSDRSRTKRGERLWSKCSLKERALPRTYAQNLRRKPD